MRKIVKEINIYNFEELKEDIKNKLINDFKDILINDTSTKGIITIYIYTT